ncbi:MAG: DUF1667 domain-containing protein [Clostridia bacterium]|nr:DUF1667 domain-containing protein [Clostridia bacterium]
MKKVGLTCVECPVGCRIEVIVDGGKAVEVTGNSCPRGKLYAENEVVCPKRVVTSTVKTDKGGMLPVKTDAPVKKTEVFNVIAKINAYTAMTPVKAGDVLIKNVDEEANVVATSDAN